MGSLAHYPCALEGVVRDNVSDPTLPALFLDHDQQTDLEEYNAKHFHANHSGGVAMAWTEKGQVVVVVVVVVQSRIVDEIVLTVVVHVEQWGQPAEKAVQAAKAVDKRKQADFVVL
jgi:hypothetical protein